MLQSNFSMLHHFAICFGHHLLSNLLSIAILQGPQDLRLLLHQLRQAAGDLLLLRQLSRQLRGAEHLLGAELGHFQAHLLEMVEAMGWKGARDVARMVYECI